MCIHKRAAYQIKISFISPLNCLVIDIYWILDASKNFTEKCCGLVSLIGFYYRLLLFKLQKNVVCSSSWKINLDYWG